MLFEIFSVNQVLYYCYVQSSDLLGVKAYFNLDLEGLYVLGTVIIDYRGYRVTAQSIIPGKVMWDYQWVVGFMG